MRYLGIISYDGTFFHGFQRQKDKVSVQKTVEDAISKVLDTNIVIKGAGRTDAKVHALGQTFHFDYDNKLPAHFKQNLNAIFEGRIKLKKIKKVDDNFHARHSALGKHYCYKINLGNYQDKYEGYIYQPKFKIDVKKLREIKNIFIGTHNFHNFTSGKREDYVSTITKIKLKRKGNKLEINFYGKAFFRYMVRNLVGAMLFYARGKVSLDEVKRMLDDEEWNRTLITAPPEALYLVKVYY